MNVDLIKANGIPPTFFPVPSLFPSLYHISGSDKPAAFNSFLVSSNSQAPSS